MSSLTTFMRPASAAAKRSTTGETIRHGPHHGAQKSIRTGTEAVISASKLSLSASTIQGSSVPQTAQRGTPSAAGRSRWRLPQLGHLTVTWPAMASPSPAGRPRRVAGERRRVRGRPKRHARGRLWFLGRRALDLLRLVRRLLPHLDAPWLELLGLGDAQLQHPIMHRRLDGVWVEAPRHADAALAPAEAALDPTPRPAAIAVRALVRVGSLPANGQDFVLELDLDVLGPEARNVHVHGDAVVGDQHVGRRQERVAVGREQTVEVAQPGRYRLHQGGHGTPPFVVVSLSLRAPQTQITRTGVGRTGCRGVKLESATARSLSSARCSICRTRSALTPSVRPSSRSVCSGPSNPKRPRRIRR